jgi:hypothetical protein
VLAEYFYAVGFHKVSTKTLGTNWLATEPGQVRRAAPSVRPVIVHGRLRHADERRPYNFTTRSILFHAKVAKGTKKTKFMFENKSTAALRLDGILGGSSLSWYSKKARNRIRMRPSHFFTRRSRRVRRGIGTTLWSLRPRFSCQALR